MTSRTGQRSSCCNLFALHNAVGYDAVANRPKRCYQLHKWTCHAVRYMIDRIVVFCMQRCSAKTVADNLACLTPKNIQWLKPSQLSHLRTLEVETKEKEVLETAAGKELTRLYEACLLKVGVSDPFQMHPGTERFLSALSLTQLAFLWKSYYDSQKYEIFEPLSEAFVSRAASTDILARSEERDEWIKYASNLLPYCNKNTVVKHSDFLLSLLESLLTRESSELFEGVQRTMVGRLGLHLPDSEKPKISQVVQGVLGGLQSERKINLSKDNLIALHQAVGQIGLLEMIPEKIDELNRRYVHSIYDIVNSFHLAPEDFAQMEPKRLSNLFARLINAFTKQWESENLYSRSYAKRPQLFGKVVSGVVAKFKANQCQIEDFTDTRLKTALLAQLDFRDVRGLSIPNHLLRALNYDVHDAYIQQLSPERLTAIFALPETEENYQLVSACFGALRFKDKGMLPAYFMAMPPKHQAQYLLLAGTSLLKDIFALPLDKPENRTLIDKALALPQITTGMGNYIVRNAFSARARDLTALEKIDPTLAKKITDTMWRT
ncbi:MAG: hypothetical protein H0X51_01775 [Parachlamydiaceae bacterium]|nr:hypothetical protein [Parachlamydiaceae bacterium]